MQKLTPVEKVSSLEAIINSIHSDTQVLRWFTLLVEQPGIRKKLLKKDNATQNLFLKLNQSQFVLTVFTGLALFWGGFIVAFSEYRYAVIIPFLIYGIVQSAKKRKTCIAQISQELLKDDFPGDILATKSLYQIAEIYGRAYGIPSLVDTLYGWDRIIRVGVLAAYFICTLIFPVRLWGYCVFIFLTIFVLNFLVQLKIIYKRLK